MGGLVLDVKDKKILYELDLNGREYVSTIARKVGLSKEVVNYRIKRLRDRGIITGFHAIIDTSKTGHRIYRLQIQYQDVSPEKEQEILDYMKKHSNIGWIATYEGFYDLAVLFWAKDVFEFRTTCDSFLAEFGKHFQNTIKTIVLHIYHYKHNFLFDTEDLTEATIGGPLRQAALDHLDLQILQILSKDCRKNTLDIGNQLHLSPNTVKYRIRKLLDNKVIVAYKTMINADKLGYQHYKVFLNLNNLTEETRKKLIGHLRVNRHVIYVTDAIGKADLEFEAHVKNIKELHTIIRNLKLQFSDMIRDTKSVLIFKEHRINYLPCTND